MWCYCTQSNECIVYILCLLCTKTWQQVSGTETLQNLSAVLLKIPLPVTAYSFNERLCSCRRFTFGFGSIPASNPLLPPDTHSLKPSQIIIWFQINKLFQQPTTSGHIVSGSKLSRGALGWYLGGRVSWKSQDGYSSLGNTNKQTKKPYPKDCCIVR